MNNRPSSIELMDSWSRQSNKKLLKHFDKDGLEEVGENTQEGT